MNSTKKAIGKRIEKIRRDRGMTKEQFAKHIGITGQFLGTIENGENCFSIDKLIKFCEKMNVSADYILLGKINFYDNSIKEILKDVNEEQLKNELETIKSIVRLIKSRHL